MRRIFLVGLISLLSHPIWGQTILMECGQNSGVNFNGWYIQPHAVFDDIEFDDRSTAFFSEWGGNYSVSMVKRIDEMSTYSQLNVLFNFESIHNCTIENVVYYTSKDGKNWRAIETSKNNCVVSFLNESLDIVYIKATVNALFYNNGKMACNYAKVEGEVKEEALLTTIDIQADLFDDSFFIFNYNHRLNIETQQTMPFELIITSLSGQIVFREAYEGSNRIDLPETMTGLFVVSIVQNGAFKASKKVLL